MKLKIYKGTAFSHVLQYASEPFIYREISAISATAPVQITVDSTGIPDGWPVAVVSADGMKEINAENSPPRLSEYVPATVVDANTVELNTVNAADFRAYTGGGYLQFCTPIDLTGATAKMVVSTKAEDGGEIIASSDAAHVTSGALQIVVSLDTEKSAITFEFADEITAAVTKKFVYYGCKLIDSTGAAHYLDSGEIEFSGEVAK